MINNLNLVKKINPITISNIINNILLYCNINNKFNSIIYKILNNTIKSFLVIIYDNFDFLKIQTINTNIIYSNLIYLNCSYNIQNISSNNIFHKSQEFPQLLLNDSLINIKYLNCNNTNISSLSSNYKNLKVLHIQNTNISQLPSDFIKLEELYCNYSYINSIPIEYINLKVLIGNHTYLQSINYYCKLEYLNCGYNTISFINSYSNKYINQKLNILHNLKFLICNNTLINNLIQDENIIFNKITNIYLNNLVYLDCSNTNIQSLPNMLNNLIYLNISNTLIKVISTRNLLNLEILICYNTPLYKLNCSMIKLKILNINNNSYIHKIPSSFQKLEFLMINNTLKIHKLSNKFTNLKYLSCENSSLIDIPITLHNLFYLNIINTNIIYFNHKNLIFYFY